ncbi:hypothetical protein MNBD_GAMMA26-1676 [hydrothermal vent metagenome]|uniref:DUF11 domain-containing protein n=1 Tax=hydrothermal vent metagenome TaxID=652676 RepID=A0A3B1APT6_9ZZZZ
MSGQIYTVSLFKRSALMSLRGGLLLLMLALCSVSLTGWAAPAGYSTYYIPGDEANLVGVFEDSNTEPFADLEDHNGYTKPIRSIIGISSWANDVQIYIDHWEDGYEFDPNNPSTADETCPVQSMGNTLVLTSLDVPSLDVERTLLGNPCDTAADPCSTSITANGCYYDGKDKIYVAGGAVTMNRAAMPESVAGIQPAVVQAIAWEVYPVRPQLTTYILPFGEDLGIDDFDRTEALVQATADNTVIQIDFNGDGNYDPIDADLDGDCDGNSVTLNDGEVLRVTRESDGDGGSGGCTITGGLNMGAVIQGSDTIQVQYVGSEPTSNIEIRGFSAFPRGLWDNQYYAPVSGHATGQGTDIFLHNPNSSAINIDYETNGGSGSFTIGANNTVSFAATEGVVPNNTAVYLASRNGEAFWGVSSIDRGAQVYDWGYSLVPAYLLKDDFFIGWAPANSAIPPSGGDADAGGVFVAAAQDNISLFVDYDADGTVDSTYSLDRLDSLYLCDVDNSANCNTAGNTAPENDADMSGARIYATGPFTAAYGQNPNTANGSTGFDLGYTTLPSADWLDLVLGVTKVTDKQVLGTGIGIVAKYTITVSTDEFSVENVTVVDTLDTGWGYCTGTDAPVVGCIGPLITFPDLTTSSDAPSIVSQVLTWDSGQFTGGQLDMTTNRTLTVEYYTYTTATHTDGQISISPVEASATRSVGSPAVTQTFRTSDKVFHLYTTADMTVTKSSGGVDPLNPGDQFTYTVTVTNSGSTDLTDIAIYDPLPDGLGYASASSSVAWPIPVYYGDDFDAQIYNNNSDNSSGLVWTTDWMEFGDTGSPTGGDLRIYQDGAEQYVLRVQDDDNRLVRKADLSGHSQAILSFDARRRGLESGEYVAVEVCDDVVAGASETCTSGWTEVVRLQNIGGPSVTDPSYISYSYDLVTYLTTPNSANFGIRFASPTGSMSNGDDVYFDNIRIALGTTAGTASAGAAPGFVIASDGYSLAVGEILTLTFDAIVDDPLATGIESATNTAYVTSAEIPVSVSDSATNIINNPSSASASVGDFVWFDVDGDGVFDVGEPGLSNVEVTLKDQFGTPVAVTTTDTAGRYGFSGVSAGTGYYVQVTAGLAAGLVQSAPAGRSDDQTNPFDLTAGANYTGADLGYTSAAGTATLGDLLWSDADGDGLYDAGEPGLGGITVELWLDVDGDGFFEPTGDDAAGQQSTTTTAADGSYLFTGVTASGTEDYFVYVNASQPALTGYIPTRTVIYSAANMSGGDVDLSADFGFQGVANTYSITDRIWADDDADQDDDNPPTNNAESGISGVTVTLKDLSGTVVASGSSDSNGYFTFSGVPAGSYVIAITDTAGKLTDYYGTTSEAVAGEFTVVGLSGNTDYSAEPSEPHFGYNLTKTIGDTVFNDINNNTSQDVGEPGLSGVTVELWLDVDDDGVFEPGGDDSAGQQATATTDASGNYLFSGVADGRYFVHVDPTQAALSGLNLTTSDDEPAAGHQLETVISGGANSLTLDFGYRSPDNRTVGGLIWDDTDQAGDITAGESGIEGVTVDLLRGVTVISTVTTLPSTEVIDGYIDIDGSGGVDTSDDGSLLGVTVIDGALDVNNNGVIDAGDDGSFAGIAVIDGLLDMNGDVTVDASDDGDLIGRYQFGGLQSDTYTARITDTGGVLGDYTTTYEKTEGTTAPFNYEESVDVTGGSVTDIHFGFYSVMTATFALIDDFQAFFEGGQVVVEWRTLSEQGTVGFHLERLDVKRDRYKRLNKKLLPGLLYSRHGGTYRYADPRARVGGTYTYRLVEVEATGNTIDHGPYTLTVGVRATPAEDQQSAVERPVPGFERVARPMSALEQARIAARHKARGKAKRQKHRRKGPMVKIQVREDGLYYLDAVELANLFTLPESKISKLVKRNRLRLTNHGKPVATLAAPDNAGLYFYGQAIDIPYTRDNIYWLSQGKGLRMATTNGRAPAPVTGQSFQAQVHVEIDQYAVTNLFQDPDADYWMWDYLMPDFGRDSLFFTVASPAAVGTEGTATLVVRLQGGSEAVDGHDHHALVRFNGADIGEIQWDGLAAQELTLELPLELLNDGDNTVEVAGVLEAGVPYSLFYVNEFALSYPRSYASENNHLEVEKAGHKTLSIGGFGSKHIMALDISNPNRPRLIKKTTIDGTDDNYQVSFRTKGNADRYLALTHDAAAVPESLVVDIPSRLKKRHQVDYLIITSSDLVPAAEELANYRRGQGLRTMVVDIEDVYDEFSFGLRNPGAIRAFLRHAYTRYRPGPRYVVLVGEGSYDYKDHMGFGDAIIPTPLTPTPDGLFPSDNLYVDVEGYDWVPEMAVGRLPVINAEELTAFLAKLQAYEAGGGAWESQAILAADAPDRGGDFPTDSEDLGALFPSNYLIDRLYLDTMPIADARQQLIDGLNGGRAFVNFIGHGSIIGLGNSGLLTSDDVAALNNAERLPVLTALTCLAGHFAYPGFDAIAENLVIKPDGGAIAVWAPSSLSKNKRSNILGRGFYEATFQDGELVLGEALLKAQTNYARDGIDKYLLDTYNLIGDPATIMK